eukprot:6175901-Pleurochrysis_carterae.AAC.1
MRVCNRLCLSASTLLLFVGGVCSWTADESWQLVEKLISEFSFLPDVSFSAGDARGRVYTFQKGELNMKTPVCRKGRVYRTCQHLFAQLLYGHFAELESALNRSSILQCETAVQNVKHAKLMR